MITTPHTSRRSFYFQHPDHEVEDAVRKPLPLRVVHLSTYDLIGGAARAAYRLHSGLRQAGVESSMFVRETGNTDRSIVRYQPTNAFLGRVERRVRREYIQRTLRPSVHPTGNHFEPFRIDRSEYGSDLISQLPAHDVVNLHWVADFVDYGSFFGPMSTGKRLVWTLHDMNAFTGGCHYDLGCGRYLTQCTQCPQLRSPGEHDLSNQIWERKKALFNRLPIDRLHVVTPSIWLANEVKKSPILNRFHVSVIPYGIDLSDFAPRDKRSAREVFGIPHQAKVVLFVADGLPLIRKGFDRLIEALRQIKARVPALCLVGVGHNSPALDLQIPYLNLGHIHNDRLLSNIYSAADVVVIPSSQDNLPNTVLESMACGTPVVGFAVGGIPDMIQHGRTGLLVPPSDTTAFGAAIWEVLKNSERQAVLSAHCRQTAVQRFSLQRQASQYNELYTKLLSAPSQPRAL
ncbi:MAG: glycosyltransferase [Nitrospira sp.]|nr:glycosyltransferase [Nitrospira sp.]